MSITPEVGLLIYTTIAFFILLGLLSKVAFPPIMGLLDERADKIRESLDAAESTREEAARLLEEYKQQLAEARSEAQKIIEDSRKLGDSMKNEIVASAKAEAKQTLERASADIEREKALAIAEIQGKIADLAIEAASRVVGRELEKQGHEQLIEQYLSEVGSLSEN
jgi:F-type H+-transporting ATPase subunit b